MAGIDKYLDIIKKGVFGRDVRKAIHDGIAQVYEDATFDGNTNMEVAKARGVNNTLSERLRNMDGIIDNSVKEVENTKKRLENIIVSGGDGNLPTELIDIRVGGDGRKYSTAGEAVRKLASGEALLENSISLKHLDFLNPDNLAFGKISKVINLNGSDSSNMLILKRDLKYCLIVRLKPNTPYTFFNARNLTKEDGYFWTKLSLTSKTVSEVIDSLDGTKINNVLTTSTTSFLDYYQFQTNEDDLTLIAQISKNVVPDYVELVEGHRTTRKYNNYDENIRPLGSVYTKKEVDSLLTSSNANSQISRLVKKGNLINLAMTSKVSYTLKHNINQEINLDTWLIRSSAVDGVNLWEGTDIEGPILEKNAVDFIGGIHGDEEYTSVIVICDGKVLDLTKDYTLDFKNLTVFVTSKLFHCNTKHEAILREKKLEFEKEKLIVSNHFTFLDNFVVNRCTIGGLYSVYKDLLTGYASDYNYKFMKSGSIDWNPNIKKVTFYGQKNFHVEIENLSGENKNFKGGVTDFYNESRPRFKAYLDVINSDEGVPFKNGDQLSASYSIKIL